MGDWVATWDRCFVEGCFTYDLAVQIVGTLGALGIALLVYWLSQKDQDSAAQKDRKQREEQFDAQMSLQREQFAAQSVQQREEVAAQAALLQQQVDNAKVATKQQGVAAEQQQARWLSEQRTHAIERELERVSQHLKTANAVSTELQRLFHKAQANDLRGLDTTFLDGLSGAYSVLPGGVKEIKVAHEMAHIMAMPEQVNPNALDYFASSLDSGITTMQNLETTLAESEQLLTERLREEAGLRLDIIAEVDEFDRFVAEHKEAPEE